MGTGYYLYGNIACIASPKSQIRGLPFSGVSFELTFCLQSFGGRELVRAGYTMKSESRTASRAR